jgi:hypothetical protein
MTLTIYTKPAGCFGCNKTKQLFADAGISFREVDITTNAAAFEYVTEELGYSQQRVYHCTLLRRFDGADSARSRALFMIMFIGTFRDPRTPGLPTSRAFPRRQV